MDFSTEHLDDTLLILYNHTDNYIKLPKVHLALKEKYPDIIIREALQLVDKLSRHGYITVEESKVFTQRKDQPDQVHYEQNFYISYEGRILVNKGGYAKHLEEVSRLEIQEMFRIN